MNEIESAAGVQFCVAVREQAAQILKRDARAVADAPSIPHSFGVGWNI